MPKGYAWGLGIIVVMSILLARAGLAQWGSAFSDLPRSHWAYEVMDSLQRLGAVTGCPDGYFRSREVRSRYEFAVALRHALARFGNYIPPPSSRRRWEPTDEDWMFQMEYRNRIPRLIEEFKCELGSLGENVDRELLIEALDRCDIHEVRVLRRRISGLSPRGRYGISVLMIGAGYGDESLVREELARGADVHTQDGTGASALQYAAAGGHGGLIELLCDAGAEVNALDEYSRTPLMWAALGGQVQGVRALLRRGADATLKGRGGSTALQAASSWVESSRAERIVRLLKAHEAKQ